MSKSSIARLIFLPILLLFIIFLIPWTRQSAAQPLQLLGKWKEVRPIDLTDIDMDFDQDGIFDVREHSLGTNPRSSDTDDDGFNDLFEENYRAFGFNPLKRTVDRDRDGLSDTFEKKWGTSPLKQDTDGDTLSDFDEVMNRQFGYDPVQYTKDSDFDGLADRLERTIGTSPYTPNSNDDMINDFQSFRAGFSPDKLIDGNLGELVGTAYSLEMGNALLKMQDGDQFPPELARELPFPAVTRRLYGPKSCSLLVVESSAKEANAELTVSAALMQQSVGINPSYSAGYPAVYPEYNKVVSFLKKIAFDFDGFPNPNIVRLFRWSQPTEGQRRIYALKISDNPDINEDEPEMLIMGLHHGKELISASFTLELIRNITKKYAIGDNKSINLAVNKSEIWIIPIVNPDGYAMAVGERRSGAKVDWRKNIRKVAELSTHGSQQTELSKGVDPNRNYGFEHIRNFSFEEIRDQINSKSYTNNGLSVVGEFEPSSETYAGMFGFSDVEARAVASLANNNFDPSDQVDDIRCSLSWHTGVRGVVIYPMNHKTEDGLNNIADRLKFNMLSNAVADTTGYVNWGDTWWDSDRGYEAFGTSDDWLYKNNGIFAITVEAYSQQEEAGLGGPAFFPESREIQEKVVANNLKGAMKFIKTCRSLDFPYPPIGTD